MDSNTINYNEEVIKAGLIVSGVSILLTMVVYVVDLELMVSGWFGFFAFALSMGLVIYTGISYRNAIGGYISYKNSLIFTFLVLLISYVVGSIFNLLLYNVIDPTLPEVMKELTVENTVTMMESFGTPQEAIDETIIGIEKGIDEGATITGVLKNSPIGIIVILIFALIASIFVKKNEPVSDRIN